ncbi:MAG: ABC transporter ATP-binding protein [Immundisolibacterales bacterium]|nr:ABC transporter ATP-binding protein [Immundisolibacterales bacterium]
MSDVAHHSIVSLRDLSVTLTGAAGPVEILRGIDLDLPAGESVSVVGPSGAGKTTLLMVVGGLERPTAGRVEVAGEDLAALDEDELARFRGAHVGIVFQAFHLIPTMTAIENVAAPRELAGAADAFERAREELAAVGLEHRLGHYPGELSGGEQQRVAIARALVNRPDLLLADEPTGNLDAATGDQVIRHLFVRCRDRKAALLLITHEARLAALCDRTIRMADGRIEAATAGDRGPDRNRGTSGGEVRGIKNGKGGGDPDGAGTEQAAPDRTPPGPSGNADAGSGTGSDGPRSAAAVTASSG